MFVAIAITPLVLISIYGIEDKNKDYFEKGDFVKNTEGWQYEYKGEVSSHGVMVSHWAKIGVVSIVIGLIITIIGVGISEYRTNRSKNGNYLYNNK